MYSLFVEGSIGKLRLTLFIHHLVPWLTSSVPDFGNLSCHLITGTTLKNTNIEIRNTKQYRNANFQNSKQKPYDMTISRFGH
jgi:hypothetical protein